MSTQAERLEFWKQIAQIVSALAVPVVLALIGYFVQRSLADAGLKKDYVQMALGVLKEQPSKENEQLRQWAIAVLDKRIHPYQSRRALRLNWLSRAHSMPSSSVHKT